MSLPSTIDFKQPAKYAVYVEVNEPIGGIKPFVGRLGPADDLSGVEKLIREDRRAMADTYGGIRGRTYRIFEAVWKELASHGGRKS